MTKDFYTALKERRTYYGINKEVQVLDEKLRNCGVCCEIYSIRFQFSNCAISCIIW